MANTKYKYSDLQLTQAVKVSKSWREVCEHLGLGAKARTGSQSHVKMRAVKAGIGFSHFIGQSWNKGRTFPKKHSLSYYLVLDGKSYINNSDLRERLIKEELKERKCEICKLTTWEGKQIPLELDHTNGNRFDNRLINLRVICPNCHAQTETYCGKNIKRRSLGGMLDAQGLDPCSSNGVRVEISERAPKLCSSCGNRCSKRSERCKNCRKTKIIWPNLQKLQQMISTSSYVAVGKLLGVSDNAVRKHIKRDYVVGRSCVSS